MTTEAYDFAELIEIIKKWSPGQMRATSQLFNDVIHRQVQGGTLVMDAECKKIVQFHCFLNSGIAPSELSKSDRELYKLIAEKLAGTPGYPNSIVNQFESPLGEMMQ